VLELELTQGRYQVVLYDGLVAVKRSLRAVSLNIAFKPLVKVLLHCKATWRRVGTFIKTRQQLCESFLRITFTTSHCLEVAARLAVRSGAGIDLNLPGALSFLANVPSHRSTLLISNCVVHR
jgi:hypothetical protein